ncbi:MAG: DUF3617 domain-containing protein [Trichlorobacter sp.]|uniref:DUF3617 domain-containing protein n=1 Tax=Trichlorobacter sp. TaxID=2911007 RepID=UPI0025658017|nr:DUF3617 family protein [Trichlorobacter sp.]MDK9717422.1 DUF3617 domain-containing protein [Trichlorobacter sp.]
MKRTIIAALGAMVLLPTGAFAADSIREGYWEVTSQTEMPGMPMKIPANTIKHCYTKEDVKDQKKVIARDKNCTMTDYKVAGNKVTWAMKCTGQSAGTFNGETIFSTDSYNSIMKMKTQGHNMTVKVKGKRIGECPKK